MLGFYPILVIANFSPHMLSVGLSSPQATQAIALHTATFHLE